MNDNLARRARQRVVMHDLGWDEASFRDAAIEGLSRPDKSIPCAFLYDEDGSHLFDRICTLPEYYQTRTEIAILRANASKLAGFIGAEATLYELGSGSSVKTPILLDALDSPHLYVPIDVSRAHLASAADTIARDYPRLRVEAVCGDYAAPDLLPAMPGPGRQSAFFPGSTIGNLARADAVTLLAAWRRRLGDDGAMVVGVDLKKDPRTIERAYNDKAGVTAAFIKNILRHANRELGADFDLNGFAYEGRYVETPGRVEMHLISKSAQNVRVGKQTFSFTEGERLHVENSHKYAVDEFAALALEAGFRVRACFTDPEHLFSVQVLSA